jgi:transcriptional regulator with XRE-family HTH domain
MSNIEGKSAAVASRLRLARESAGLSQGQVAKLLKLHRPSISEMEAGRRKVSAEELKELARIYNVRVSWLACEDTEEPDPNQDRIQLAARELAKLKQEDLDRVLQLLSALRDKESSN